jgi:hypothetical protein
MSAAWDIVCKSNSRQKKSNLYHLENYTYYHEMCYEFLSAEVGIGILIHVYLTLFFTGAMVCSYSELRTC